MATKEIVRAHLEFLKNNSNYSGRRIASLSEEFGYKFSEATLIKSYKDKEEYKVPEATSEEILKVLKRLLKLEVKDNPELSDKIKEANIDLSGVELIKPSENKIEMPWKKSQEYELNAERVIGITPTLEWARHKIDKIIEACSNKKKRKYHYILTEQRGITNKLVIEDKVNRAIDDKVIEKKQIEIRELDKLYDLDGDEISVTIPIPYDIVIYEDTHAKNWEKDKRTIVVTSKVAVDHSTIEKDEKENYEDIIIDPNRGEELKIWAEKTWKKLEEFECKSDD